MNYFADNRLQITEILQVANNRQTTVASVYQMPQKGASDG